MKISTFCSLFVLISCSFTVGYSIRKQVGKDFFDHYLLAVQWSSCFGSGTQSFSIHGLWPNDSVLSKSPTYCTPELFNLSTVSKVPDIYTLWPSYGSKTTEAFWKHEWDAHGTCSGLSQSDYFNLAIVLAKRVDLKAALSRGGVNPGNSYQVTDFLTAFQLTLKNNVPLIICVPKNLIWLQEVRLNYTNDDMTGQKALLQSIVGTPYGPICMGNMIRY